MNSIEFGILLVVYIGWLVIFYAMTNDTQATSKRFLIAAFSALAFLPIQIFVAYLGFLTAI